MDSDTRSHHRRNLLIPLFNEDRQALAKKESYKYRWSNGEM